MSNNNFEQDTARSLGEAITSISENVSLLIHQEVELAKAEITTKVTRLLIGAGVGVAAGFFILLGVIALVNSGAWGLAEVFGNRPWLGFLLAAGTLFLLAALAALIASRTFKNSSPVPEMAIEQARITKEMIESSAKQ